MSKCVKLGRQDRIPTFTMTSGSSLPLERDITKQWCPQCVVTKGLSSIITEIPPSYVVDASNSTHRTIQRCTYRIPTIASLCGSVLRPTRHIDGRILAFTYSLASCMCDVHSCQVMILYFGIDLITCERKTRQNSGKIFPGKPLCSCLPLIPALRMPQQGRLFAYELNTTSYVMNGQKALPFDTAA